MIRGLLEARLRRGTHGIEPAADVYLGMGFTAVMPGSGRIGGLRIPSVDRKIRISAPNHEPVRGISGHKSTDFTSEFLQRRHRSSPFSVAGQAFTSQAWLVADLV